jgi:ADP-heptose:LPS heptosyltransferase
VGAAIATPIVSSHGSAASADCAVSLYPRARVLNPLPAPLAAERVLVIRLGALGDVVRTRFALPALRELYPRARLDWLVEDGCAAGLLGAPELDEVIALPRARLAPGRPWRWGAVLGPALAGLRARRYDLAIDFHSGLKSALLARLAQIPQRVGYDRGFAREGAARWFTHRAQVTPLHLPRFERNAALVRFLGGGPCERLPGLVLDPALAQALPALPERFAVLHPGTSGGTLYKRWSGEAFAALARGLAGELGLPALVSWGPVRGEREAAERIVAASGGAAQLAPPTASLGVLLALLRRARLFVGSDSGPVHLAALCGCPQVVLFGPTDPIENAPFPGLPSAAVRRDVGCGPCREGCPARTCMARLEPAAALAAARAVLARGLPQARSEPAC